MGTAQTCGEIRAVRYRDADKFPLQGRGAFSWVSFNPTRRWRCKTQIRRIKGLKNLNLFIAERRVRIQDQTRLRSIALFGFDQIEVGQRFRRGANLDTSVGENASCF